ncbi:MAG: sensor histidine kinase [Bryobacterales bacterium]|nr:sensor histidine kinase [Bryobacterales bacterium]
MTTSVPRATTHPDVEARPDQDIASAEETLRQHESALLEARQERARRIAQEFHDDAIQRLAVIAMGVHQAAQDAPSGVANTLLTLQERIVEVSQTIRRLCHRVYPSILDDLGLVCSVEGLCAEFQRLHGIPTVFRAADMPSVLRPQVASCLYFVVQESLDNVARHARAESVTVLMSATAEDFHLQVIDSGTGFAAEQVRYGIGIPAMRERVRLTRGAINICSEPGAGTRVDVALPLAAE